MIKLKLHCHQDDSILIISIREQGNYIEEVTEIIKYLHFSI